MKTFIITIFLAVFHVVQLYAQVPYYTIFRVDGSKEKSIPVGKGKVEKCNGDTINENNCKIWWTHNDQSLEASYSKDGKTYTFHASAYFRCKDKAQRNKYAYLKYLRTVTTGAKGTEKSYYSSMPVFMVKGKIKIDEFDLPVDNSHKYILVCNAKDSTVEIEPARIKGTTIMFSKKQFEKAGVNVGDPNTHFILYYNNQSVVNTLTIDVLQ